MSGESCPKQRVENTSSTVKQAHPAEVTNTHQGSESDVLLCVAPKCGVDEYDFAKVCAG